MTSRKQSKRRRRHANHRPGSPARRGPNRQSPFAKASRRVPSLESAAPNRTDAVSDPRAQKVLRARQKLTEIRDWIAGALDHDHPAIFLATASGWLAVIADREGWDLSRPAMRETLTVYGGCGAREFQALAYVWSRIAGDEQVRAHLDDELGSAIDQLPESLRQLDQVRPTGSWIAVDDLGSEVTLGIGLSFPSGHELTLLVGLNVDTQPVIVGTDVCLLDLDTAADDWRELPGIEDVQSISSLEAWAHLSFGLPFTELVGLPDPEDRHLLPLVHWVLRMLPTDDEPDDHGYLPELDDDQIIRNFLASPHAEQMADDPDIESIVKSLINLRLWVSDPLKWSDSAVSTTLAYVVLTWHPLGRDYLIKYPPTLAALIRYGHHDRKVDQGRTDDSLAAIDEITPKFAAKLNEVCVPRSGPAGRELLRLLDAGSAHEVAWDVVDLDELTGDGDVERSADRDADPSG